jgi:hypothetical protein
VLGEGPTPGCIRPAGDEMYGNGHKDFDVISFETYTPVFVITSHTESHLTKRQSSRGFYLSKACGKILTGSKLVLCKDDPDCKASSPGTKKH